MAFDLKQRHPTYTEYFPDWELLRDSYRGERAVKFKGQKYLPATSSHIMDGVNSDTNSSGFSAYASYKLRARFPNFTREAVQMAIGMMHSQPPEISLPKAMESIRSSKGEILPNLLRRINTEQLITGRIGLMVDLPTSGSNTPYLTTYSSERITNWDDGDNELIPQTLNLVILDEAEYERKNGFDWSKNEKFRVLVLGNIEENTNDGNYRQGVFKDGTFIAANLIEPSRMGKKLDRIPFIIINSSDLIADIDEPPLLDLGNVCMAIYRGEADYRQNLFMQGQDTLVTIGMNIDEDTAIRTGSGARLDVPLGGDAKYAGVTSQGLMEQREALQNLEARAGSMGAQTLDTTSRERESGDSLRIRVAARTADMNQIVETGAQGLEEALKIAAEWMGENPDEVSVNANKEFGEMPLTGQTMVEMATARTLGWPISARTLHNLSLKRRMTSLSYEEEKKAAEEERKDPNFVFAIPDTADRAGADQNGNGPKEIKKDKSDG